MELFGPRQKKTPTLIGVYKQGLAPPPWAGLVLHNKDKYLSDFCQGIVDSKTIPGERNDDRDARRN
jgi:hypothetical protein